jgi:hypothetical protein
MLDSKGVCFLPGKLCTIVKFINFVISPRRKLQPEFFHGGVFKQLPWCMICCGEQCDAESYVD